jgi:hypothetical protein
MNVEHILARKGREVRAIRPNASPEDALQRLRQDRIGSLVVSENGTDLVGILSDRDILDAIADHGTEVLGESVGGAMTAKVFTCSRDDRVSASRRCDRPARLARPGGRVGRPAVRYDQHRRRGQAPPGRAPGRGRGDAREDSTVLPAWPRQAGPEHGWTGSYR